ncbi:MAG: amino acid ABC transporter permease [Alphaproteobacteria bacterium]|nr:amino acid ABC transporter permease [Alphaproteobacteria bacterium]
MDLSMLDTLIPALAFIGQGALMTLTLLLGGLMLGLALAIIWSIMRYRNMGTPLIKGLVSFLRGTPLILQLSFVYFAAPTLVGIKLDILGAGILTFGLNSGAYLSEILRSGLESLPKGQFEAARTLQIPAFPLWKDIILPQVIQAILPSLTNEAIALLKETALISTIGGMDIMRRAQAVAAEKFTYFMPLCLAAVYYYGLVLLIEYIGKQIEKRGAYAAA